MKEIFVITVDDIQRIALEKVGRKLDDYELYRVKKGIASGLEFWEEVVGYAIRDVVETRNKQGNAI